MSEIILKVRKSIMTEILLSVSKSGREDMYYSLSIIFVIKYIHFTSLKYHLFNFKYKRLNCTFIHCNVYQCLYWNQFKSLAVLVRNLRTVVSLDLQMLFTDILESI